MDTTQLMVNDVVNQILIERKEREDGGIDINVRVVPIKVEGVCKTGIYDNVGEGGADVLHFVDADILEPIPLTEDLLLVNGFKKELEYPASTYIEDGAYPVYTFKGDKYGSILRITKGSLMAYDNPCSLWLVEFDLKRKLIGSVDQLQRWLRALAMQPAYKNGGVLYQPLLDLANNFVVVYGGLSYILSGDEIPMWSSIERKAKECEIEWLSEGRQVERFGDVISEEEKALINNIYKAIYGLDRLSGRVEPDIEEICVKYIRVKDRLTKLKVDNK